MNHSVTATLPVPSRRRRTFVAIALIPVLAIGAGLGIAALASGGSESAVSRSAPATPPARVIGLTCPSDVQNLLSAVVAMPPSVSAQVIRSLSPDLSQGLGNLALFVEPSRLPPAPDATTLGQLLARLDRGDRNAVMSGLPAEQRAAVAAAVEQSAVFASRFGVPLACP
jgi:hypothetical protein